MRNYDSEPDHWLVWFLKENRIFLLRILLFLLGFAMLMAGELYLVNRHRHFVLANEQLRNALPPNPQPVSAIASQPPPEPVFPSQNPVYPVMVENNFDGDLAKVNAVLDAEPQNVAAYEFRGDLYAANKKWDEAIKDYQTILQIGGKNVLVQLNVADIEFRQKEYDQARPDFAALEADSNMGDFASYEVFLCDLYGGHDEIASKELDAFNQVSANPSYFYANAAWSLYHRKTEDARGWLANAGNIYSPEKVKLYTLSLTDLGYLPLPAPTQP